MIHTTFLQRMLRTHGYARVASHATTSPRMITLLAEALSESCVSGVRIQIGAFEFSRSGLIDKENGELDTLMFDTSPDKIYLKTDDGFVWSVECAIAHIDDA